MRVNRNSKNGESNREVKKGVFWYIGLRRTFDYGRQRCRGQSDANTPHMERKTATTMREGVEERVTTEDRSQAGKGICKTM